MSHKMFQHPASSKGLKLLPMNLIGGRNNILCVKIDKGILIYDLGLGEMTDNMLEQMLQQIMSECDMTFKLTYCLGLHVKQIRVSTCVSQNKCGLEKQMGTIGYFLNENLLLRKRANGTLSLTIIST